MSGKVVAAISSHVMRGTVGLRASQFALERRGHTVWSVPTVLLPWHPGQGASTRTINDALTTQLSELAGQQAAPDAILTGYFAGADQVEAAARFIDAVRDKNADVLVLVDPVSGDTTGRYVPDAVADALREVLLPQADITTPNSFEAKDLGVTEPDGTVAAGFAAREVVVTSTVDARGELGVQLMFASERALIHHAQFEKAPNGTGDLFAGVYLSRRIEGAAPREALVDAAAAVIGVIGRTSGSDLALQSAQSAIEAPDRALVWME